MMVRVHISKIPISSKDLLTVRNLVNAHYVYYDSVDSESLVDIIKSNKLRRVDSNIYSNEDSSILLIVNKHLLIQKDAISSNLTEMRRVQLVGKARKDTKARFERRKTINDSMVKYDSFDINKFLLTGILVFNIKVKNYVVTLEIPGVLDYLKEIINDGKKVNYKNIQSYLSKSIDKKDIKIDCTCPDFRYRFAYTATMGDFKANSKELRPSNITNPNRIGSSCKHILYLISNKKWIKKYVSLINLLIKLNPQLLK